MAAPAARPPRATFAHQKTVCLVVEDDIELDALTIVRFLPALKSLVWFRNLVESVSTSP